MKYMDEHNIPMSPLSSLYQREVQILNRYQ